MRLPRSTGNFCAKSPKMRKCAFLNGIYGIYYFAHFRQLFAHFLVIFYALPLRLPPPLTSSLPPLSTSKFNPPPLTQPFAHV